jgi:hypothetical protein
MPEAKKGRPKKRVDPNKPKLSYQENGMKWVLRADWRSPSGEVIKAGTPMNPPKPSWAVKSGGEIDFNRFIKTWNDAMTLEDVHKKFFWKSPQQLQRQRGSISKWLEEEDIYPLKVLRSKKAARKVWSKQLAALLDAGELKRKRSHQTPEGVIGFAQKAEEEGN